MNVERLAILLEDLDRIPATLRMNLLQGKLDLAKPERVFEGAAVPFLCDLLTAALACDIIRSNDRKLGDSPTRIYIKREKARAWSRFLGVAVFTVIGPTGKAQLNPEMFSVPEESVELIPPPL